jgi:hypothetical protein
LSKKKSCSPAVKMNSPPQSAHVNKRSTNSIAASPDLRDRLKTQWNSLQVSVSNRPAVMMVRRPGGPAKRRKQYSKTAAEARMPAAFASRKRESIAGIFFTDGPFSLERAILSGAFIFSPAPCGPSCDFVCERALL